LASAEKDDSKVRFGNKLLIGFTIILFLGAIASGVFYIYPNISVKQMQGETKNEGSNTTILLEECPKPKIRSRIGNCKECAPDEEVSADGFDCLPKCTEHEIRLENG